MSEAAKVAVVTGVGTGSLGEAIAGALRDLGFRVLDLDADLPDHRGHARDGADQPRLGRGVRRVGAGEHRPARRAGQQRRRPPRPALGLARAAPGRRHGGALAHQLPRHRPADPAADPAAAGHRARTTATPGWSTSSPSCTPAAATTGSTATSRRTTRGRRTAPPSWRWSTRPHEIERRYGDARAARLLGAPRLGGHQHRRPRPRDRAAAGPAAQAGRAAGAPGPQVARPTAPGPWSSARPRRRPSRVATTASSAPSTPSEDAQDEEAGRILWDNTSGLGRRGLNRALVGPRRRADHCPDRG